MREPVFVDAAGVLGCYLTTSKRIQPDTLQGL